VLIAQFARLVQVAGLPAPRFERVGLAGGIIANAVALPAGKASAVLFTDTLLAFETDEVVGICAHEIAHLEYYNPRRLRRLSASTYTLIVTGTLHVPIGRLFAPSSVAWTASLAWTIAAA